MEEVVMYFVYDETESATQYMRTQLNKMAKDLGLKSYQIIREYVSRGVKLTQGKEIYKMLSNGEMEKII